MIYRSRFLSGNTVSHPLLSSSCPAVFPRLTACFGARLYVPSTRHKFHTSAAMADNRAVFFFDIDNCLYPKSKRVHELMSDLIDKYFQNHLELSQADANQLHMRYYKDYGLAIEGLVRHHKVNPLEYNRLVDDALPLEDILSPNPKLRKLIEDLDKTKVKPWLFTNAYVSHGKRVVKLLGVDDLFEGITFCDYGAEKLLCKPAPDMFKKAMNEAGIDSVKDCYFVDDSAINAVGATSIGWTAAHLVEPGVKAPETPASKYQISNLEQLRELFPQFFSSSPNGNVTGR